MIISNKDFAKKKTTHSVEERIGVHAHNLLSAFSGSILCTILSCWFFLGTSSDTSIWGIVFAVITVFGIAMFLKTLFKLTGLAEGLCKKN